MAAVEEGAKYIVSFYWGYLEDCAALGLDCSTECPTQEAAEEAYTKINTYYNNMLIANRKYETKSKCSSEHEKAFQTCTGMIQYVKNAYARIIGNCKHVKETGKGLGGLCMIDTECLAYTEYLQWVKCNSLYREFLEGGAWGCSDSKTSRGRNERSC